MRFISRRRHFNKRTMVRSRDRKRRPVTMDINALVDFVLSKKEEAVIRKAMRKAVEEDRLMLTDVSLEEAMAFATKRKKNRGETAEHIRDVLVSVAGQPIVIQPIPPIEELRKTIRMDDDDDLKIVYSSNITDSVILITRDHHFYRVTGLKARVLTPDEYIYEEEFPEDFNHNTGYVERGDGQ